MITPISVTLTCAFPAETYTQILDELDPHEMWFVRGVCRSWKAHVEWRLSKWITTARLWISRGTVCLRTEQLYLIKQPRFYTDAQFLYDRHGGHLAHFVLQHEIHVSAEDMAQLEDPTFPVDTYFEPCYMIKEPLAGLVAVTTDGEQTISLDWLRFFGRLFRIYLAHKQKYAEYLEHREVLEVLESELRA